MSQEVTHYIITNREVTVNTPGRRYRKKDWLKVNSKEYIRTDGAEEAQDNLRYGEVVFEDAVIRQHVKSQKKITFDDVSVELYEDLHRRDFLDDIEYEDVLAERQNEGFQLGSDRLFTHLHSCGLAEENERHDILIFAHGYHVDFEHAVELIARLHTFYVTEGSPIKTIVMFTWPARRNLLRYRDDARDAFLSGYAMSRAFMKLRRQFHDLMRARESFCRHSMHLMAHSMGNRVVESMIGELLVHDQRPNNLFGEIILVAADVDDIAFDDSKPLYHLIELGERIHVYYHRKDRALGVSERTKNAFNRLGRWGIRRLGHAPDNVFQSDVTYVGDADDRWLQKRMSSREIQFYGKERFVNHWYYLSSPAVIQDILDVLDGKNSVFMS